MKIDLHLHTRQYSSCAVDSVVSMLEAACAFGLDAVAITEHDRLIADPELRELGRRFAPLRVLRGIEVTIGNEHLLVHGVSHPALESRALTYPELWRLVRAEGGLLTLAHPFRYSPEIELDLVSYPPDALELYSTHVTSSSRPAIEALASRLGIATLSTSDAHHARDVGIHHIELREPAESEAELWQAIRRGWFDHRLRSVRTSQAQGQAEPELELTSL